MAKPNYKWRNAMLAKVHIAKKNIPHMDDDLYRDLLEEMFGKRSAGKLTMRELADFLDHLETRGAEFPNSGEKARQPQENFYEIPDGTVHARQKRWIAVMWQALGFKMSGLDERSRRQMGADKFLWVTDQAKLQTVANDLVGRCKKAGIDPYDVQPAR